MFRDGKFYSKRILMNFYSQRLLMYGRAQEFEKAEYYGYLSIRSRNSDYLYYVNNLAAILLRKRKATEALGVLRGAVAESKDSHNFHSRNGHAAYITLAMNQLKQYRQAETHASTYFNVYKKQVLEQRWHLYFTAWLEALLYLKSFAKILKLAQAYELRQKDQAYQKRPNYVPAIPWMLSIAGYKLEKISAKQVASQILLDITASVQKNDHSLSAAWFDLIDMANTLIPGNYVGSPWAIAETAGCFPA